MIKVYYNPNRPNQTKKTKQAKMDWQDKNGQYQHKEKKLNFAMGL